MKLAEGVSRKGRRLDKAAGVILPPEQQPNNQFFDYETDLPAGVRDRTERQIFGEIRSGKLGSVGHLQLFEWLEGPAMLELTQVLRQADQLVRRLQGVDLTDPEIVFDRDDADVRMDLEKLLDLIIIFPEENPNYRLFFDKIKDVCSPEKFRTQVPKGNDWLVANMFLGYRLFPEYRSEYQQIIQEHLDEYLEYFSSYSTDDAEVSLALRTLMQLRVMLPEAAGRMREAAVPFKLSWLDWSADPSFEVKSYMSTAYSLLVLASEEVEVNNRGRAIPQPKQAIAMGRPLPERQTL